MMTIRAWLEAHGRQFPEADADGCYTEAAYAAAKLPMIVACTECRMTMALVPERCCDAAGRVFCDDCGERA